MMREERAAALVRCGDVCIPLDQQPADFQVALVSRDM
jgi:hypothetical protein